MKKIFILFVLFLMTLLNNANAELLKKIEIKGNKRISNETIVLFSGIQIEEDVNSDKLNDIISDLYETNFFSDVKINFTNNVLTISVIENPIIQTIIFNGIKAEKIQKQLKNVIKLKEKSSFVEQTSKEDLQSLKNGLKKSGYYFSEITLSIQSNQNDTINLIYDIELGEKASITKIKFLGDKKFSDNKLRKIILSEQDKFWKFISKSKYLDEKRIQTDERLLKNFYINKGFYEAKITRSFAKYLDENSFELVFNINAGKKFYFNELNLIIPQDFNPDNFTKIKNKLVELSGEVYSYRNVEKLLDEVELIALQDQFDTIKANIVETIVEDNKLDFTITLEDSKKFIVKRIDIIGNNITNENVIRNAFVLDEGDSFNEILLSKSVNNLKGRNIFKTVNSSVIQSDDTNKIIQIEVEEKPTGEISAGAGIGSTGGNIGFSVNENNYLGKGIILGANITLSEESIKGKFSYNQPNYKNTDRALLMSVQNTTYDRLADMGYKSTNTGGSIGTRYEQYEDVYFSPGFAVSYDKIETSNTASDNYKKQKGDYFDTNFNYVIVKDKRNQRYQPSSGHLHKFFQELPLYSKNYTLSNGYEFQKYHEILDNLTSAFSFTAQTVTPLADKDVRVSKRIIMPSSKLRGFEPAKVGPVDNFDYVGGNYLMAVNLSTELPNLARDFQNVDFKLFLDAANIWGVDYDSKVGQSNKIRSAAGVGVDWFTPIGPMSFSLSQAITKAESDTTETFRFNLGTTF